MPKRRDIGFDTQVAPATKQICIKGPNQVGRSQMKRCLGEGNSNTNSSDARSSDISNDLKHRANDAQDGS